MFEGIACMGVFSMAAVCLANSAVVRCSFKAVAVSYGNGTTSILSNGCGWQSFVPHKEILFLAFQISCLGTWRVMQLQHGPRVRKCTKREIDLTSLQARPDVMCLRSNTSDGVSSRGGRCHLRVSPFFPFAPIYHASLCSASTPKCPADEQIPEPLRTPAPPPHSASSASAPEVSSLPRPLLPNQLICNLPLLALAQLRTMGLSGRRESPRTAALCGFSPLTQISCWL